MNQNFTFLPNSPTPLVRKIHRWQCRHRPIGHIAPIRTLHTTPCFRYQLFGNVHLKLINSSAVNTTIRERIALTHDPHLLVNAFCTFVRPILEYCCIVWNPRHKYEIDKLKLFSDVLLSDYEVFTICHILTGYDHYILIAWLAGEP